MRGDHKRLQREHGGAPAAEETGRAGRYAAPGSSGERELRLTAGRRPP